MPLQGEPGLLLEVARGDPDPVADRAEAEPRQPGPEQVALAPLGLRDREDGKDPALGQRGPPPLEDAPVAVVEDLSRL